jgi:cleavage and polyadenylation specificity factor subunit 1
LDGAVLGRWNELAKQRRADVCGRMGVTEEQVIRDIEVVCGGGVLGL